MHIITKKQTNIGLLKAQNTLGYIIKSILSIYIGYIEELDDACIEVTSVVPTILKGVFK